MNSFEKKRIAAQRMSTQTATQAPGWARQADEDKANNMRDKRSILDPGDSLVCTGKPMVGSLKRQMDTANRTTGSVCLQP